MKGGAFITTLQPKLDYIADLTPGVDIAS